MTTKEKAKAYDEALERARKWCEELPMNNGMLKDIFPKLAESEDEKIRKHLIARLKPLAETDGIFDYRITKDKVLAYLEKQKESKSTIPSRNEILGIWSLGNIWKDYPEEREGLTQLQFIQKHWYDKNDYNSE